MRACSLHHHTSFSFGDGYRMPNDHVARAVELGYSAMAVTEHGNVSSHFQFEKAAVKAGLKPIFGMEAYCGSVDQETRGAYKNHLTILAANASGYRSLNRIVARSYQDYYYHPTVSGSSLADNSDGIIVLSGCSGSLLACALLGGKGTPEHNERPDLDPARKVISRFQRIFGDRYFLEVQPFYELPRVCMMNKNYARLADETGVPLVVTFDVHYPKQSDSDMQAVLHAVHRGKASVDDAMREWNYDVPLTLPETEEALAKRLVRTGLTKSQAWQAIEMSGYIGDMCNVTLPKAEPLRYRPREEDLVSWV